jgi:hypothetical protein
VPPGHGIGECCVHACSMTVRSGSPSIQMFRAPESKRPRRIGAGPSHYKVCVTLGGKRATTLSTWMAASMGIAPPGNHLRVRPVPQALEPWRLGGHGSVPIQAPKIDPSNHTSNHGGGLRATCDRPIDAPRPTSAAPNDPGALWWLPRRRPQCRRPCRGPTSRAPYLLRGRAATLAADPNSADLQWVNL